MQTVLWIALGVGGATVFGAILGFFIKNPSPRFNDAFLSFAAGVMLTASVLSLLLPALEYGKLSVLNTVSGIFLGALCIHALHALTTKLPMLVGTQAHTDQLGKVLLFVIAIAIHNLPEGIVTGVGLGTGNFEQAFTIAVSIALQNIPEGLVIIAPMIGAGISKPRTFLIALITGIIEIIGTFLGYFAVKFMTAILPFTLAFAGGTMLYVVVNEMIPAPHERGNGIIASYAFLVGVTFMLVFDFLIC